MMDGLLLLLRLLQIQDKHEAGQILLVPGAEGYEVIEQDPAAKRLWQPRL